MKLLILSSNQFGYLTDTLKYCEYASEEFEITYVGWDYGKPKIHLPGITVKYVSRNASLPVRNFRLLRAFHHEIGRGYDIVFANYLPGISLVRIFNQSAKFIVDVRTLCVHGHKISRFISDFVLKLEVSIFKNVSVISEGIAKKLNLKNYFILPLGGECFASESKSFDKLSFLYVGTLQGRNMLDCVKGFHLYLKKYGKETSMPVFTIVGNSPGNELREIGEYVSKNGLNDSIILAGSVPQNKLSPFFESANIGVSYIPKRSYFNYQPPTKTFEYLISGLPVIATSTFENLNIVNKDVGVLIDDNAKAFCEGVTKIEEQKGYFDSDSIKRAYADFTWKNLVKNEFSALIKSVK